MRAPGAAKLPNVWWRAIAALFYLVPSWDVVIYGEEVWSLFKTSIWLMLPFEASLPFYGGSQFTPLIIFFVIYLAVVKNLKLLHFVRFHAMQSVMLDIASMVYSVILPNLPEPIRMSRVMNYCDMYFYSIAMFTVMWCVVGCLMGCYSEVKFISESVYVQVEQVQHMQ